MAELSLTLGAYQVYPIPTGPFGLDGGAMFGTVPKPLWEKALPADAQNRVRMQARALLLVSSVHRILIDTGNGGDFVAKHGDKLGSKFASLFDIADDGLVQYLQALGLRVDDITDVILTHLHFDHAGGATTFDPQQQRIVPRFPNARYHVQQQNWENANAPNVRERASYLPANFLPLQAAGRLNLLADNIGLALPGIEVLLSHGHTRGQQLVKITGGDAVLVYCGDLIPTSHHVRLAWIMGYDIAPLTLIEEKQALLQEAAQHGWYLFLEHDPDCDVVQVDAVGEDFQVAARFCLRLPTEPIT